MCKYRYFSEIITMFFLLSNYMCRCGYFRLSPDWERGRGPGALFLCKMSAQIVAKKCQTTGFFRCFLNYCKSTFLTHHVLPFFFPFCYPPPPFLPRGRRWCLFPHNLPSRKIILPCRASCVFLQPDF